MKRKKSIRLLLIVTMVISLAISLSVIPTYAANNNYDGVVVASGSCGTNVNYEVYRVDADNYTLVISGNGAMDDNKSSLWSTYSPKTLYVEDGVYHIGAYSFNGFNDIHLSDGISSIGKYAFQNCTFDSLHLPENLLTLGEGAFSEGYISGELVIPEGVTNIPKNAFKPYSAFQTQKITSITLPSTLVSIGDYAFQYAAIHELTLPDSVRSLGYHSFSNCDMETLVLSKNLKEVAQEAFFGCGKLKNITIPNGVEIIGKNAFSNCGSDGYRLEIEIPASVKEIKDGGFSCYVKSLYFYGDQPIFGSYPISTGVGYYLADNVTWNASTLPSNITWKTWYNLESCNISYDEKVEYTGSYIKPAVTITCAGQELEFGTQYTLRYANNKELGTADIEITGMNECRGHVTKHFDITKKIENCNITIDDQVFFTGEKVTPNYSVTDGDKTLVEGQDYSVSFKNNVALGSATATFKGEGYYTDTVDKTFEIVEKDHVWNEGEITKPVTCTEDGVRTFTCKGCGQTRTEAIPSEGHKYSTEYTVDKEPSCTEKGSKSHHCTVCGAIQPGSSVDIDMVDHDYGAWETTKEVTCTEDGSRKKVCKNCGDTVTEAIPSEGHKYSTDYTVDKQPSCTEKGSKSHHCTVCGAIQPGSSVDIDMVDHDYGAWETTKEATCTRDGSRKKVCKNCGDTIEEVIKAEGHDWNSGKTTEKATCTEDGMKVYTCNVCGDTREETLPALGHKYDEEYTVDVAATCTEEGVKSIHCIRCDKKKSGSEEIIPKKSHSWNSEYTIDKGATYASAGSKSIHCSACNAVKEGSKKSIPKLTVKATTLSKVTAAKKGFTAKWKKGSGINGYEIQYALNGKFTKSKKSVKVTKPGTLSKKVTKLNAKKKYWVRIRTYKKVSGKTYYSAWSKAKTVTTKK